MVQLMSPLQALRKPPYWLPSSDIPHCVAEAFSAPTPPPGINRSNWFDWTPPLLMIWTIIVLPFSAGVPFLSPFVLFVPVNCCCFLCLLVFLFLVVVVFAFFCVSS